MTAEDDSMAPGRDLAMIKLASIMDAVRHAAPNPRCPQPRPVAAADLTSQAMDQAMRDALASARFAICWRRMPDGGTVNMPLVAIRDKALAVDP